MKSLGLSLFVGFLVLCSMFLQPISVVTGQDPTATPMACSGPIQEPGCPGYTPPDQPTQEPFQQSQQSNSQQSGISSSDHKGLITPNVWPFKVYLQSGKLVLWGPKGNFYVEYFKLKSPTANVDKNTKIKSYNGIDFYQLTGSSLVIKCQVAIGDGNEYVFACGTVK